MKQALFVDEASKMSRLSTNPRLSMDGVDKEMRLVYLPLGYKIFLKFGNVVFLGVYLRDYKP